MKKKHDELTNGAVDLTDPDKVRKTPHTEAELDLLVDGFVKGPDGIKVWEELIKDVGKTKAREILKKGFRRMDECNIDNMKPEDVLH